VAFTPPIESILPRADLVPITDGRLPAELEGPSELRYLAVQFRSLDAENETFEPIVVNAFIWDPGVPRLQKPPERVSET
jgi:hypothetical protein